MGQARITPLHGNFKNILKITAEGLWALVRYASGQCVSFTTKKILKYAEYDGGSVSPVTLSLIRHVLMQLKEKDYLQIDDSRKTRRYVLCRDSPLWDLIKQSGGPEDVFAFIEKVVD